MNLNQKLRDERLKFESKFQEMDAKFNHKSSGVLSELLQNREEMPNFRKMRTKWLSMHMNQEICNWLNLQLKIFTPDWDNLIMWWGFVRAILKNLKQVESLNEAETKRIFPEISQGEITDEEEIEN